MPPRPASHKLRRSRALRAEGPIATQLPSSANPASRVVEAASDQPLPPEVLDLLDAPAGPLAVEALRDRLVRGDALSVLQRCPDGLAACAITSPPYWNLVDYGCAGQIGRESYPEYRARLRAVWRELARCLRPNGKFCLNVPLMPLKKAVSAEHFGRSHTRLILDLPGDLKADILEATDLRLYSLYIWEKQTTEKMFGSYPYPPNLLERNYVEFILVFVKPGAPPKFPRAVKERARLTQDEWLELTKQIWWMYPANVKRNQGHPAPFPEALPNRLLSMYSFPAVPELGFAGDLVLDPFAGWGTTCVAAKRCGRRYLGIELSADFCREATRRLEETPLDPQVMPARRPQG